MFNETLKDKMKKFESKNEDELNNITITDVWKNELTLEHIDGNLVITVCESYGTPQVILLNREKVKFLKECLNRI